MTRAPRRGFYRTEVLTQPGCGNAQICAVDGYMMITQALTLWLSKLSTGVQIMLFTIAIVLVVLWALGLVSGTTVGGFVHVLLVIAIIMVLFQFISGRRVG